MPPRATIRGVRFALGAVAAGAALLTAALPASAHGRFPKSNQFVFSQTDHNLVIMRTTYGILVSHDNGQSWSFLCEDTLGLLVTPYEDPSLGLTTNNSLVAGLSLGLNVSTDIGCSWNCVGGPLAGQGITDIAVRPDTPSSVVALTLTYLASDAGGGNYQQIFQTTDNGTTWAPLGIPLDPLVSVTTINVAKTDPNRIYVSGTRNYGANRTASLFVSTDAGAHWVEHPLAQFDPNLEDSIYIGAVDPTSADRVYIRSDGQIGGGQSRLFVSSDAGQSFQVAKTFDVPMETLTGELLGFALSADGSKVYAGSKEDGLWVAATADLKFSKTSSIHVQCLATRGNELWACSDAVSGFVGGVSTDDGARFTTKLATISGINGIVACTAKGPLGCGAPYAAAQCGATFDTFCSLDSLTGQCVPDVLDGGPVADGRADASHGSDSGPESPHASSSSCGCSAAGGGAGSARIGACAALVAVALRRRRKAQ